MNKEFFKGMNLAEDISDEDFNQICEDYKKIEAKISKEDFIKEFNERKAEFADASFMDDMTILSLVVGPLSEEENQVLSEVEDNAPVKIADVEDGNHGFSIVARIMSISTPREFTSSKGKPGKLCNLQIADDTASIRLTLWSENIKHLNKITEGDLVKFTNVDCRNNRYNSKNEFSLRPRSDIKVIDESSEFYPKNIDDFPVYESKFTQIKDIDKEGAVSLVARLIKVPEPRAYDSHGKSGKVLSLELLDETGKISYTLWNKDVYIVSSLGLKEGDVVKIINEQVRERNGEFSISHWSGRIIKVDDEDYDLPMYSCEFIKIGDAHEQKDVCIHGIVTKVLDVVDFNKENGGSGLVRTIEIGDETGSIRVTLWGDDTRLEIAKGDMIKVIGGNVEYDDYSRAYRVNTNWNTQFKLNCDDDLKLKSNLEGKYLNQLVPIAISKIQEFDEEDGVEVDILGRLISISDASSFIRDDGTEGMLRSANFADSSKGIVRVSFWDEKAQYPFVVGNAYKIENARTRINIEVELNVNKTTRFFEVPEGNVENLPSLVELEDLIYTTRKIGDLDEDEYNIKVIGRILDVQDMREFTKNDGTTGLVRNIEIGDDTGIVKAVLWDSLADIACDVGDPIKVQNPRVNYNNGGFELNIGNNSSILEPSQSELLDIPSVDELESILFVSKPISNLEQEDKNVKVNGKLKDIYTEKILIYKCPNCNNTIDKDDTECYVCNTELTSPNYILMVSGILDDGTDEIQVAFFNNLAEELIEMKKDELVKVVLESGDEQIFAPNLKKLNGLSLELLADVNYDEIGDRNRLRPKKIISKS